MILGEGGLTVMDVHMYMKKIFLSMISEYILNFFAFQLLYCFLEACLICSPTMKRHEIRKNSMRFGSGSVFLFFYHQCFYTYETFEHFERAYGLSILISLLKLFFNWDLLHARLNSHYKAWSCKKKKQKKIKTYRKSL